MSEIKTRKPKKLIDYKNGKIYQIVSDLPDLVGKCLYIGSTVNTFAKRWGQHKAKLQLCPNRPLYKNINAHRGFDHFKMVLIHNFECKDKNELTAEEQKQIELKRPLWNGRGAIYTAEKYDQGLQNHKLKHTGITVHCGVCDRDISKAHILRHRKSEIHKDNLKALHNKGEMLDTPLEPVKHPPKNSVKTHRCEICDISITCLGRHILTQRHINNVKRKNDDESDDENDEA